MALPSKANLFDSSVFDFRSFQMGALAGEEASHSVVIALAYFSANMGEMIP